jgi:hypothetical protein
MLVNFTSIIGQNIIHFTGDETTESEFKGIPKSTKPSTRDLMELPSAVSLKKYAPPVKDQGSYGTCVAWSCAYAARSISYSIQNKTTHSDSIIKYSFSPGHLYSRIKKADDRNCILGASILSALKKLKEEGNLLYNEFMQDCSLVNINIYKNLGPDFRIKDYLSLTTEFENISKNEILAAKKSISENKPLLISLKCYESLSNVGKDGMWHLKTNEPQKGRHAMCIIGFDDNKAGGSFEIMNSWGVDWGNKGFFWLSYEQAIKYGAYIVELSDFEKTDFNQTGNLQLSGMIEFVNLDGKPMPVTRKNINTRSIIVEDDDTADYFQYKLTNIYPGGTSFKIKFTTTAPAYVYIFAQDNQKIISKLFPYDESISGLINSSNTTVFLPSETKHARISNIPGTENICVIYSKRNVNINKIYEALQNSRSVLSKVIKNELEENLLPVNRVNFSANKISFHALADESDILCFFIKMEHR